MQHLRYICLRCGRPCDGDVEYDSKTKEATITVYSHSDCNPRLMRFFEPESQHFPPFGR